jgi:ankyrin repeat protein
MDTKAIQNVFDIDEELKVHQETHRKRSKSVYNLTLLHNSNLPVPPTNLNNSLMVNFYQVSVKETLYKLITEGDDKALNKIEEIFKKNSTQPKKLSPSDPNYLFNQLLSNGKNLLYVACQEGNIEIVDYLLNKGLNTKIKSKSDDNEFETPLQVGARWGYTTIVKLLLEKGGYDSVDVENTLKCKGLKKGMINMLKIHLRTIRRRKGCVCF